MLLFAMSFDDRPLEEIIEDADQIFVGGICDYARVVVAGVEAKREEIDEQLSRYLKRGWSISRISKTSLAILRLSAYEIFYLENIPDSVSVNEAVELAKKYTIDEYKFINGVLGSLARAEDDAK